MSEEQDSQPTLVKLPLWRSALDELSRDGVNYGQTISAAWFEKHLRCERDSMQFGLAISEIRRELEKQGFYLSGRGQKRNQFVILPPASNSKVMENYGAMAVDALKRGVILGTNTRLDSLNPSERQRHQGVLERMALKAVLLHRSQSIAKVLKESHPNLLKRNPGSNEAAA